MSSIYLEDLNLSQQRAVLHRGSNLLIIAGAGSGKTRTLTRRAVSYLQEIEPENLMVVTFTKKAANEIVTRISHEVPSQLQKALKQAWIGTFHSICWRMLLENGHLIGLKSNWTILDMPDSYRVMASAANSSMDEAKEIYALYSYARNSMTDWREWVSSQRFPNVKNAVQVERGINNYARRCSQSHRIDFDDLQMLAYKLLVEHPNVRNVYRERYKAIMVDEYQDTNRIQAHILEALMQTANVTVVGDDAQSVYGFRAATVENILEYKNKFKADVITLDINYRSTPQIVSLSNESIRKNPKQIAKEIRSNNPNGTKPMVFGGTNPTQEALFVLDKIIQHLDTGTKLDDIAVLFRATRLGAALEVELKRTNIPYVVVGGEDFFSLEHIKFIMDFLRLQVNPEDMIALNNLREFLRFGSASLIEKFEHLSTSSGQSFWDTVHLNKNNVHASQQEELSSLLKFFSVLTRFKSSDKFSEIVVKSVKILQSTLQKKFSHAWDEVKEDIQVFINVASEFDTLANFVSTVSLDQFIDEEQEDGIKPLILSTVHSAKGLEWNTVFVIGLVEFWFPLNFAIQQSGSDTEERRLFYVATTRAKNSLYLTHHRQSKNPNGRVYDQTISRFIRELPDNTYETTNLINQPQSLYEKAITVVENYKKAYRIPTTEQPSNHALVNSIPSQQPERLPQLRSNNVTPEARSISPLEKSKMLYEKGQQEEALAALQQILSEDNRCAEAYAQRAKICFDNDDYIGAVADFTQGIVLKNNPLWYWDRGLIFELTGHIQRAWDDYNQAVAIDATDEDFWAARGRIQLKLGRIAAALEDINKAITLNASIPEFFVQRAELKYQHLDDVEGAINDFAQVERLASDEVFWRYRRALLYFHIDLYKTTLDELDIFLKAHPQHLNALLLQGRCFEEMGYLDNAKVTYSTVIGLEKADARGYYNRAQVCIKQNDLFGARADLAQAVQLDRQYLQDLNQLEAMIVHQQNNVN